jgi:hypothetical protein
MVVALRAVVSLEEVLANSAAVVVAGVPAEAILIRYVQAKSVGCGTARRMDVWNLVRMGVRTCALNAAKSIVRAVGVLILIQGESARPRKVKQEHAGRDTAAQPR